MGETELVAEAFTTPRVAAAFAYDAFASYSTVPDYGLVRKTEEFLEGFHRLPFVSEGKLRPLRICVDGSDFQVARGTRRRGVLDDAVKAAIVGCLEQSRYLLLFCS